MSASTNHVPEMQITFQLFSLGNHLFLKPLPLFFDVDLFVFWRSSVKHQFVDSDLIIHTYKPPIKLRVFIFFFGLIECYPDILWQLPIRFIFVPLSFWFLWVFAYTVGVLLQTWRWYWSFWITLNNWLLKHFSNRVRSTQHKMRILSRHAVWRRSF